MEYELIDEIRQRNRKQNSTHPHQISSFQENQISKRERQSIDNNIIRYKQFISTLDTHTHVQTNIGNQINMKLLHSKQRVLWRGGGERILKKNDRIDKRLGISSRFHPKS